MKTAITTLEIALHNLETNAPIYRAEGNGALAIVQEQDAAEIRGAIAILKAVDAGPIWEKPQYSAFVQVDRQCA